MPGANASDFFGEGTLSGPGAAAPRPKRDWATNPPRTMAEWELMQRETATAEQPYVGGYVGPRDVSGGASYDPEAQAQAYAQGNQGATAGYAMGDAATRAAYDEYHRNNDIATGFAKFPGEVARFFGGFEREFIHRGQGGAPTATDTDTGPTVGAGGVPEFQYPMDPMPSGPTTPTGTGTGTPDGTGAPTVNRDQIDPLLQGLSTYQNDIYALSKDNTGLSAAEAQLQKATQLANINAAIQADQSQRAALGAARGARNRGDRALLEQQAIGEAGYIGQDAARTAAMRQAENEGNLAQLRAAEENYDREFKLKAIEKASQLGLNVAALELDISKADLASATNLINQQFQQLGIDKQLTSDQAIASMNFARDMATIQFQYDKLSVEDQNEADRLLMQKYNIDQETMVALRKIKEENDWDWNKLAAGFVTGVTPVAAKAVLA